MSIGKNKYIKKVKSIDLENFRGIRKLDKPLNLDADIVLLNGPNGFGKTSIIDALCLLVTGFYYPDREPLIFNKQNYGSIEAEIECICEGQTIVEKTTVELISEKKKDKEEVRIKRDGVEIQYNDVERQHNERSAKASFYYYDLIRYMFDEEGENVITLRDILSPVPVGIQNIKGVLKTKTKNISEKKKEYENYLEEAINERLKMYTEDLKLKYIEFRQTWNYAAQLARECKMELPFFDDSTDVNQFGSIEVIEKELADIINQCNSIEGLPNIPGNENNAHLLFENYLQILKQHVTETLKERHKLKFYLESLIDDCIPDADIIAQKKIELQQTEREKRELEDRQGKLQKLEKYYQAEDEKEQYGLLEVLEIIGRNCEKWCVLPDFIDPDDKPPEDIVRWLYNLKESFYVNDVGIDELFSNWYNKIKEKRKITDEKLVEKDKQCESLKRTVGLYESIVNLINKSDEILSFLSELGWGHGGKISKVHFLEWYSKFETNYDSTVESLIHEMDKLQNGIKDLKEIIDKLTEQQSRLRQSSRYQKAIEQLKELEQILRKESSEEDSILEEVISLPSKTMGKYKEFVNKVFKRFRLVGGLYPVSLQEDTLKSGKTTKNILRFNMKDGRTIKMLSAGQKAQLALSLLLGLNMAIGKELNHGIIALDDTSAAFDMAQLAREAILLRQIAYGEGIDDDGNNGHFANRQLFIVSHHEDLTHRLLDFLTPPEGKKLHILNFVDWDYEKGPIIEQYCLEPGLKVNHSSIEQFGQLLDSVVSSVEWETRV